MFIFPVDHIFVPQLKETFAHNDRPIRSLINFLLCKIIFKRKHKKKKFTPLGDSYSILFQKLRKIGVIECIPPYRPNPNAPGFQVNERCEYNSGDPGHTTDNYCTLNGAIQKLMDHGVFVVTNDQNTPNVANNPLPTQNNLVGYGL